MMLHGGGPGGPGQHPGYHDPAQLAAAAAASGLPIYPGAYGSGYPFNPALGPYGGMAPGYGGAPPGMHAAMQHHAAAAAAAAAAARGPLGDPRAGGANPGPRPVHQMPPPPPGVGGMAVGMPLPPRHHHPRPPPGTPGVSSGVQVVVHNLPWTTTWQDLKDAFAACDGVERADVILDAAGRSRGFGTVRFSTIAGAKAAVEAMNGAEVAGRTITVRVDRFA